jgi:rod shape-determining protein MreD
MMVSRMRLFLVACLALLLSIISLSAPWSFFRPLWVLAFVLYVQVTLPNRRFRVSLVLLLGLSLDALGAGLMGQQAFALLLTVWVVSKRAQRFRLFPISQQMVGVGVFCLLYELTFAVTEWFMGYSVSLWAIVPPVMMTVLMWPWLLYAGDRLFFTRSPKAT